METEVTRLFEESVDRLSKDEFTFVQYEMGRAIAKVLKQHDIDPMSFDGAEFEFSYRREYLGTKLMDSAFLDVRDGSDAEDRLRKVRKYRFQARFEQAIISKDRKRIPNFI